jgi:hypothetical protein
MQPADAIDRYRRNVRRRPDKARREFIRMYATGVVSATLPLLLKSEISLQACGPPPAQAPTTQPPTGDGQQYRDRIKAKYDQLVSEGLNPELARRAAVTVYELSKRILGNDLDPEWISWLVEKYTQGHVYAVAGSEQLPTGPQMACLLYYAQSSPDRRDRVDRSPQRGIDITAPNGHLFLPDGSKMEPPPFMFKSVQRGPELWNFEHRLERNEEMIHQLDGMCDANFEGHFLSRAEGPYANQQYAYQLTRFHKQFYPPTIDWLYDNFPTALEGNPHAGYYSSLSGDMLRGSKWPPDKWPEVDRDSFNLAFLSEDAPPGIADGTYEGYRIGLKTARGIYDEMEPKTFTILELAIFLRDRKGWSNDGQIPECGMRSLTYAKIRRAGGDPTIPFLYDFTGADGQWYGHVSASCLVEGQYISEPDSMAGSVPNDFLDPSARYGLNAEKGRNAMSERGLKLKGLFVRTLSERAPIDQLYFEE